MVTLVALLQAPVQGLLRPAMWLPCFHRLHSHTETWRVDVEPAGFVKALQETVCALNDRGDFRETFDIHRVSADGGFVRLFAFTRAEWLDVVEVTRTNNGTYTVTSFSSGLFPLIIPFACILNLAMFWVPFLDNGCNKRRLQEVRSSLAIPVTVVD
ncbi:uncharacterized protein LOC128232473 [Mya arenaria]|uniref:uncharacterized protein LOC128232473 n=1 Tax=Mya arenaria TaxID=6604 RepID=UPI0022E36BE1|nr:uncharacterized protein LOC128232473 [Mya arenaria]